MDLSWPQALVYSVGILCVAPIAFGVVRAILLAILGEDIAWWRK